MINEVNVDLGMLRAFAQLYELRHVTQAAKALGLSQPAMSHTLARLREVFGDALFVRTPRGMVSTARADLLSAPIARVLSDVDTLFSVKEHLTPKQLRRSYSVSAADYGHIVIFPSLMKALANEAPHVDVVGLPQPSDLELALERGSVDLAIGIGGASAKLMCQKLFDEEFVSVVRRGHPVLRRGLDLERYAQLSHILIAPGGRPGGKVDEVLAELGLSRRVRVRVPSFAAAILLVAESDMVLTAPQRLVAHFGRKLPIAVRRPPIAIPTFGIWQYWHERSQRDAEHIFLREQVVAASKNGANWLSLRAPNPQRSARGRP